MRRGRSRRAAWMLSLLGAPTLLVAAISGCSGRTQQQPGADSGASGASNAPSGASGASNAPPGVSGASNAPPGASGASNAPPGASGASSSGTGGAAAGGAAVAGAGGEPTAGAGGEAPDPEIEVLPNQYPLPAMCAQPRPEQPPLLGSTSACAPGCREVVGFALDAQRGCIDTAAGRLVTCSCGAQMFRTNNAEACLKTKDGRKWLVARGNELGLQPEQGAAQPPASFDRNLYGACSDEEASELRAAASCELSACEQRAASHCSVAGANAGIWTMSCQNQVQNFPAYDAQGCLKPSCEGDDDCQIEERCVRGVGWVPNCTFDSDGGCDCGGSWSAYFDPAVCVDVATAGPRGAWERYRAEDFDRGVIWDLWADGTLLITARGMLKQTQVTASDMEYLNQELNNYGMRAGMQNGFQCEVSGGGGSPGIVTLVVAGKAYARDLSGCFYDLPLTHVLRQYGQ